MKAAQGVLSSMDHSNSSHDESTRRAAEREGFLKVSKSKKELQSGETWYLISAKWMHWWQDYVNLSQNNEQMDTSRPPSITNTELIDTNTEEGDDSDRNVRVKRGVMEGKDYEIIDEESWNFLASLYSFDVKIPVVCYGSPPSLEIHPYLLYVVLSTNPNASHKFYFSKYTKIEQVKGEVCKKMSLQENCVSVWNFFGESKREQLDTADGLSLPLHEAGIEDSQHIFFEVSSTPTTSSSSSSASSASSASSVSTKVEGDAKRRTKRQRIANYYKHKKVERGLTGLTNMGNTCFLNSSIQCLSNALPLCEYFLSKKYIDEINTENPIGRGGELAESFGYLLEELWSGEYASIAPRELKFKLAKFASQFAGFQQHDAQELLSFLLDGLHEDLNRVKEKPYIDLDSINSDNTLHESQIAEKAWQVHLQRNNSIIVDLFQGQLKSTITCPDCRYVSRTFDPFMYLSLPLPLKTHRVINVTLVRHDDTSTPKLLELRVPKIGTMKDITTKISQQMGITHPLLLAEVVQSNFVKFFSENSNVRDLRDDSLYVYTVGGNQNEATVSRVVTSVVHKVMRKPSISQKRKGFYYQSTVNVSHPFLLSISRTISGKKLYSLIWSRVKKWIDDSKLENFKTNSAEYVQKLIHLKVVTESGDVEVHFSEEPVIIRDNNFIVCEWDYKIYKSIKEDLSDTEEFTGNMGQQPTTVTLQSCIELFTSEEQLGKDDTWYCPKCKDHKAALKKLDLWKTPDILVIHLKRFSFRNQFWRDKIDVIVDFPIHNLNLSQHLPPFVSTQDATYELFAVCNHYGSLNYGHYTCFAKNAHLNKWFEFDDERCSQMEESAVKTKNAYVLFYQKKSSNVSMLDLVQKMKLISTGIHAPVDSSLTSLLPSKSNSLTPQVTTKEILD